MDAGGISGPDERKFERRTSDINKRLKELENKLVSFKYDFCDFLKCIVLYAVGHNWFIVPWQFACSALLPFTSLLWNVIWRG